MSDQKRLKALQQLEDPENLKLLYDYAGRFRVFATGSFAEGTKVKDVVHEAIVKLMDEIRDWDDSKYPDVTVPLRGTIKSIISHTPVLKYYKDRARPKGQDGKEIPVENLAAVSHS